MVNGEADQSGGLMYVVKSSTINMDYLKIDNVKATNAYGGLAYISASATGLSSASITNNRVTNVQSKLSGSMFYSLSNSATFTASNNGFQCLSAPYTTNEPELSAQTPLIGGAFFIKDAVKFVSTTNTVKWCYLGDTGGAFHIENS